MIDFNNILVTGCAGFIGYHLSKRLLDEGTSVVGVDNLNDYYDVDLKLDRIQQLIKRKNFQFIKDDISDRRSMESLFSDIKFNVVVNLAAQAGVRYSLENPHAYIDANIVGFTNILEGCRHSKVEHLVFASSSSVYGSNKELPFSTKHNVDNPISLYAATKKANELMAHTYSHLYGLPCTGLRFFTVYGPWGRPDMALGIFAKAIMEEKPIKVFNHGNMRRDFTYIDDIVHGIVKIMDQPNSYKIYNIGNNRTVDLKEFITVLESHLGKEAIKDYVDMQPGDVPETYADIEDFVKAVRFRPKTTICQGIERYVEWFKDYYKY
jgi:UDP-glucuronate 4-epimerase